MNNTHIDFLVNRIAAKLRHEHITSSNFTMNTAKEVISRCVGVSVLTPVLDQYTDEIKTEMDKMIIADDTAVNECQLTLF